MILLTVGQPKSASTYVAQLARRAAALAAGPQAGLIETYLSDQAQVSGMFWAGGLAPLAAISASMAPGEVIALKTHAPPPDDLRPYRDGGSIRVILSYRDAADAALSCFDAGAKLRAEGSDKQTGFQALATHRQAIDFMQRHLDASILPWLRSGVGTAFAFDEVTNDPTRLIQTLAQTVGIGADRLASDKAALRLLGGQDRVYNFNQGTSGRAAQVFSAQDLAYSKERAGRFAAFCTGGLSREEL